MNNETKTLFENTNKNLFKLFAGYKIFLLDDDWKDKSGITHVKKSGEDSEEIDAIAIKDNTILFINSYSGKKDDTLENKIKPFFRNLKYLKDISNLDFRFEISNLQSKRGKRNKKYCDHVLNYINEKKLKHFFLIFKKIIFCPNIKIYREQIGGIDDSEAVIDQGHFKCFDYIIDNVGYTYLNNELSYFLKIYMKDIKRKISSGYNNEPLQTRGIRSVNLKLEKESDKEMYSVCVSVEDIIKFIHVFRSADYYNKNAFQRMVNGERLDKISKFYLNKNSTFPNNIILALNPSFYNSQNKSKWKPNDKEIKLFQEFGSIIIIDGQHRLLAHLKDEERDIHNYILANFIFFPNSETAFTDMRETFYVINTEQKRLSIAMVLKILAAKNPNIIKSIFYRVFEDLNKDENSCLFQKIEFEEKELRNESAKLHISSVIQYGGINQIAKGDKKVLGFNNFKTEQQDEFSFYKLFLKKYFEIINEVIPIKDLDPVTIGGLLRLSRQFLNDNKTKDAIISLTKIDTPVSDESKNKLKDYLKKIPFMRLGELDYSGNNWAPMEGFFMGCIRKNYPRFGVGKILKKKAQKALKEGRKFVT